MTAIAAQRFGRTWVAGGAEVEEWFREHLFVAHGARRLFALKLHRLVPDERHEIDLGERGLPAHETFRDVVTAASIVEAPWPLEWIFVTDYEAIERRRTLVFFFRGGEPRPFVVVKVRPHGASGAALASEQAALDSLRGASFASTVPSVIGYRTDPGVELLALSVLPGRSMYAAMNNALAPEKQVARHFALAADWLSDFQREQRGAHGDFWVRNLLVQGASISVVDWEHFDANADPLLDVLHFPLTYVLNVSRRENRAAYSFRRGFVEESVLSREVRKWFSRFAALHSLSGKAMHEKFIEHLTLASATADARPQLDAEDWRRILEIAREEQCVFSG